MELVIGILAGTVVGALVVGFMAKAKNAEQSVRVRTLQEQLQALKAEEAALRAQHDQAQQSRVQAETRAQETEKRLQEQLVFLDQAQSKMSDSLKVIAAEALANNNEGFLTLAAEKFKALKEESSGDLKARQEAIESLVKPVSETLKAYQQETKELEAMRIHHMSTLGEQLRSLAEQQGALQSETTKLAQALNSSQARGRWGEIALRKTVELAGMTKYCDFVEQESAEGDNNRSRPDMIVRLPAGREVIVDSKVSIQGFMDALEAKDDLQREKSLQRHARLVQQRVNDLATKAYWEQFQEAPEFVVLFIPNDSFLAAAAERDGNLIENALSKKVVIATPTTLIALLRAIAYGWRQQQLEDHAKEISRLGQDLYDRVAIFSEHLTRLGSSLGKAMDSYNQSIASWSSRVVPSMRKFQELGAAGKKDIKDPELLDQTARTLISSDQT